MRPQLSYCLQNLAFKSTQAVEKASSLAVERSLSFCLVCLTVNLWTERLAQDGVTKRSPSAQHFALQFVQSAFITDVVSLL